MSFPRRGWVRDADDQRHDHAVNWWYFHERDDGTVFARGGRVRTARRAREELRRAWDLDRIDAEGTAELRRDRFKLEHDGSLTPIPRTGARA